jgi:hypothetical protein
VRSAKINAKINVVDFSLLGTVNEGKYVLEPTLGSKART